MKTRITELLGTNCPILMGPMRFITLGRIAALASKYGGFGQIAASGLSPEQLREEIREARTITERPFGVNFPVYRPRTDELIDVAISEGIKTITTSAGNPKNFIKKIKESGLRILHKVSTVEMAIKAEEVGVDGIIATGTEAGGHVGKAGITTFCLIPQVRKAVTIPIIAAGGIASASQFKAVSALGGDGVEIGTRFLATKEFPVPDYFKQAILNARCDSTVLIGKGEMPMRVLNNIASKRILVLQEKGEDKEKVRAEEDRLYIDSRGDEENSILPCGQIAGIIDNILTIEEVIKQISVGILGR